MRATILATALVLLAAPAGRAASGWLFDPAAGGSAGVAAAGGAPLLRLSCAGGGGARLFVGTRGLRLADGLDQTAVVDIDGTAFIAPARAGEADGAPVLVRRLPGAEFRQLAEALAKGKAAEVATPAGRFRVPLGGSGKALRSLLAACG